MKFGMLKPVLAFATALIAAFAMVRYSQLGALAIHAGIDALLPAQSGITANVSTRNSSYSLFLTLAWLPLGVLAAANLGVAVATGQNSRPYWHQTLLLTLLCGICAAQFWPGEVLIRASCFALLLMSTLALASLLLWLQWQQVTETWGYRLFNQLNLFATVAICLATPVFYLVFAGEATLGSTFIIANVESWQVNIFVVVTGVAALWWKRRRDHHLHAPL